eukprot:CAMPEP_0185844992 /NCGR_PEP_ID=MMETSP1354-20130828/1074_1 /TAXON_ID=708628 /ORGANISM="Erythrolobus madagascarensis, Strain CCMP3276" /LENGTH=653 /DNA_ID=CAMNT_0028544841 /DNA_START=307 /DNA_END=2268 /DNA_ORIENTATION=-
MRTSAETQEAGAEKKTLAELRGSDGGAEKKGSGSSVNSGGPVTPKRVPDFNGDMGHLHSGLPTARTPAHGQGGAGKFSSGPANSVALQPSPVLVAAAGPSSHAPTTPTFSAQAAAAATRENESEAIVGVGSAGGDLSSPALGISGAARRKKERKPYTITKNRESWTPDEHERFLEALRRFDRDWKRIEAHVGSKNVIQIRSHAQKYFIKVQKHNTGEHVPPPRPKRKRSATNQENLPNGVCGSPRPAGTDGNRPARKNNASSSAHPASVRVSGASPATSFPAGQPNGLGLHGAASSLAQGRSHGVVSAGNGRSNAITPSSTQGPAALWQSGKTRLFSKASIIPEAGAPGAQSFAVSPTSFSGGGVPRPPPPPSASPEAARNSSAERPSVPKLRRVLPNTASRAPQAVHAPPKPLAVAEPNSQNPLSAQQAFGAPPQPPIVKSGATMSILAGDVATSIETVPVDCEGRFLVAGETRVAPPGAVLEDAFMGSMLSACPPFGDAFGSRTVTPVAPDSVIEALALSTPGEQSEWGGLDGYAVGGQLNAHSGDLAEAFPVGGVPSMGSSASGSLEMFPNFESIYTFFAACFEVQTEERELVALLSELRLSLLDCEIVKLLAYNLGFNLRTEFCVPQPVRPPGDASLHVGSPSIPPASY